MNTRYLTIRYLLYFVMFALVFTSCAGNGAQATRDSILGKAEAATLLGDMPIEEAAVSLVAIQAHLASGAQKADLTYMMHNELHQIAVFVSRGAKAPTGGYYYYLAAVDTVHATLLRTADVMRRFGIDAKAITTYQGMKDALLYKGFREIVPCAFPGLWQALRLGIGYLRTLGGAVSDIIILPIGVIAPENNPLLQGQVWIEQ